MKEYDKIRIRVNGLIVHNDSLLMVRLHSPVSDSEVWMPPGGGIEFGESIKDGMEREVFEETGITVLKEGLRYVNEVIKDRIHAVELYYDCKYVSGEPELGLDPELPESKQILKEAAFIPLTEFEHLPIVPGLVKKYFWDDYQNNRFSVRENRSIH